MESEWAAGGAQHSFSIRIPGRCFDGSCAPGGGEDGRQEERAPVTVRDVVKQLEKRGQGWFLAGNEALAGVDACGHQYFNHWSPKHRPADCAECCDVRVWEADLRHAAFKKAVLAGPCADTEGASPSRAHLLGLDERLSDVLARVRAAREADTGGCAEEPPLTRYGRRGILKADVAHRNEELQVGNVLHLRVSFGRKAEIESAHESPNIANQTFARSFTHPFLYRNASCRAPRIRRR